MAELQYRSSKLIFWPTHRLSDIPKLVSRSLDLAASFGRWFMNESWAKLKKVEILFCLNYSPRNDSGSNFCQSLNIQRIFRIFWILSTALIRLDCLIKTRLIFGGSFCANTLGAIFVILEGLTRRRKVNLKFLTSKNYVQ